VIRQRALHALDVRRPQTSAAHAVHHLDATGERGGEPLSDLAGTVRRPIVDDEDADAFDFHELPDQVGKRLSLVVGRDDDRAGADGIDCAQRLSIIPATRAVIETVHADASELMFGST